MLFVSYCNAKFFFQKSDNYQKKELNQINLKCTVSSYQRKQN